MKRLRELRESKGLSQVELGNAIGVSSMSISSCERAKRQPAFQIVNRLADYFGVTTDYLLGRSDAPVPNSADMVFPEPTSVPEDEVAILEGDSGFALHLGGGQTYSDLTEEEQIELYEYYKYLKTRYGTTQNNEDDG